jgi:hypothetical protein
VRGGCWQCGNVAHLMAAAFPPRTGRNLRHPLGAMSRTPGDKSREDFLIWKVLPENVILRSMVPHQPLELHRQHQGRDGAGGKIGRLGELIDVTSLFAERGE